MCVVRTLDPEFAERRKNEPLPSYWRALEAIFVTLSIQDSMSCAFPCRPRRMICRNGETGFQ